MSHRAECQCSKPCSLEGEAIKARRQLMNEPRLVELNRYVSDAESRLAQALGGGIKLPSFDPCDGGIHARCLILLQDPGPLVETTGFVSSDNPDPTAEHLFRALRQAGLRREEWLLWNAFPWPLEKRRPSAADIALAVGEIRRLLEILPRLEAVVFCGVHAQRLALPIHEAMHTLRLFASPHPSRLGRLSPNATEEIQRALKKVSDVLSRPPADADL